MFKDTEKAFISYVCINLFLSMNTIISTSIVYFLKEVNPNEVRTIHRIFIATNSMSSKLQLVGANICMPNSVDFFCIIKTY